MELEGIDLDKVKIYRCKNCGLHYASEKMAKKCYDWCKKKGTCNIEITKSSIEVMRENDKEDRK